MLPMTPRGHMGARPWTDKQFSAVSTEPSRYAIHRPGRRSRVIRGTTPQCNSRYYGGALGFAPPFITLLKEVTEPFGHLTERLASA